MAVQGRSAEQAGAAAKAIAGAMKEIVRDAGKVNLPTLIGRVLGPVAGGEEPSGENQAAG